MIASVQLSLLEEERFGVRSARATRVTSEDLPEILEFCRQNGVVFLIARCSAEDTSAVHAMEREGFLLMDTLVYFLRKLKRYPIPEDTPGATLRPFRAEDEGAVVRVAEETFLGYSGHYHADPRLARKRCDDTYVSWAVRGCMDRQVAAHAVVAELAGNIVGFMTYRLNSPTQGEPILGGVISSAQGQGLYRSFLIEGMNWCVSQGAAEMILSTQIVNVAVQRVWTRLGAEPSHSLYTFHKWFA